MVKRYGWSITSQCIKEYQLLLFCQKITYNLYRTRKRINLFLTMLATDFSYKLVLQSALETCLSGSSAKLCSLAKMEEIHVPPCPSKTIIRLPMPFARVASLLLQTRVNWLFKWSANKLTLSNRIRTRRALNTWRSSIRMLLSLNTLLSLTEMILNFPGKYWAVIVFS